MVTSSQQLRGMILLGRLYRATKGCQRARLRLRSVTVSVGDKSDIDFAISGGKIIPSKHRIGVPTYVYGVEVRAIT